MDIVDVAVEVDVGLLSAEGKGLSGRLSHFGITEARKGLKAEHGDIRGICRVEDALRKRHDSAGSEVDDHPLA